MLKSYLRLATRNLIRDKGYSFINITGLAIGMAACLLILMFVQAEIAFDSFHKKADRIYRLNKVVTPQTGGTEYHAITPGLMGPTMVADFPEVEQTVRVLPWFGEVLVSREQNAIKLPEVLIADSTFFSVFDFKLLRGDENSALSAPMSMVLTEETAAKFFGNEDPIGQTLIGLNSHTYTITGIAESPPENSSLLYDAIISWTSTIPGTGALSFAWLNRWSTQVNFTYLQMAENADVDALAAKFPGFMETYMPDRTGQYALYLQSLGNIHLQSGNLRYSDRLVLGNITYVYLFSVIAVLILFIACINFVNLSTARAAKRAKEVGVRKVLGAHRQQLSKQFLGESVLFSFLALIMAGTLIEIIMPSFNAFTGKSLDFNVINNPLMLFAMVGITLMVGLISGLYPAAVLSGFRPIVTLKGAWKGSSKGTTLRKVLVTAQFAVSIALIAGTAIVYQQMQFMQDRDLGFQKDQIVVLPIGTTEISDKYEAFKTELLQNPNITHAAGSNSVPGMSTMSFSLRPEGKPETENWVSHAVRVDDYDLLETYGLEMTAGRYFSADFSTDATHAVVINEALARSLGWEDPVGKRLDIGGEVEEGTVIGVVKDFHMRSLHHNIEPMLFYMAPRWGNISVRISNHDVAGTLAFIQQKWQSFEARHPFEYFFLDRRFAEFYESEQRLMQTFGLFASLAILIACLGLLGLATFSSEQRTKEIGIRKVLGASAGAIMLLLSKDFVRQVIIGFVLAVPLAYGTMVLWLKNFAYRVEPGPIVFLLAGGTALVIAFLTVAYQAIRAALTNPVNSLKYE